MGVGFVRSTAFIFVFMIFLQGIIYAEEARVEKNTEYISDKLLVIFYPEATAEKKAAIRKGLGAELIKCLKEINAEVWKLPEGIPIDAAMNKLKKESSVECSEPEYRYKPLPAYGADMLGRQ